MIRSDVPIATSDVAAHYDSLDRFYRDIWGEHVHHGYWEIGRESTEEAVVHLSKVLAAWIRINPQDAICDVGCGYGGTSRLLAETFDAHVVGFTLSQQQAAFARTKHVSRGSVEVVCEDFLSNDRAASSFDGLISIECLEHVADKQAAFQEAYRLLKPGKRIAVALWAACEEPNRIQAHLLQAICREGRLPSLPSGEEYTALMRNAGFQVINEREIGDQVKKTWSICAKRLAMRIASDAGYRSFLLNSSSKDRIFALTLVRILVAFEMKAMRYWIYAAEKPL